MMAYTVYSTIGPLKDVGKKLNVSFPIHKELPGINKGGLSKETFFVSSLIFSCSRVAQHCIYGCVYQCIIIPCLVLVVTGSGGRICFTE